MLEKIAQNPYLGLISGLVLLVSSGYETWHTLDHFSLGAHHGALAFSLIHILKTLPELREGALTVAEARSAA